MSRSLNKVQLIGNVGQDPEIRHTSDGKPIANLSIATSDTWNDKQGQKQEKTEWHRVVIFGKLAEIAEKYVSKGSKLYLEGKLQTRKWTDKEGNDKYTTEIVLTQFEGSFIMLDGKQEGQQQEASQTQQTYGQPSQHEQAKQNGYQPQPDMDDESDIPF
jgi:single-strand DNA-binding protein